MKNNKAILGILFILLLVATGVLFVINESTIALIPIDNNCTKIIEENNTFIVNMSAMNIIERSCEYFGSSYLGRYIGTKSIAGITHKSPIIIEESKNIIYFPTTSPRLKECTWLALKHIKKYESKDGRSLVFLENGQVLDIDISYFSFDNQYLRATKLDSILNKRKN